MKNIVIDFKEIKEIENFYTIIQNELNLPDSFGNNLDALYDVLTSEWEMPLQIKFEHLTPLQLIQFEALINTLKEIELELDGFYFDYYITLK
ncbi:MAG: barstar family protein [Chitinophagales bacterium]|nr:barstar family protein [Chitinophagales bacterium]